MTTSYYLGQLEAAGITTPAMARAREIMARELVAPSFANTTDAITTTLAEDLAAGNLPEDELTRRLSTILARRSRVLVGLLDQARSLLADQARNVLADDHAALGKALRGLIDGATKRHSDAAKILKRRGVIHPAEAMELGAETASACALRGEAVTDLNRLARLRTDLIGAGILRTDSGAGMVTTAVKEGPRGRCECELAVGYDRRYDRRHRNVRRAVAAQMEAGGVACARCGRPIVPGSEWHLDHRDDGPGYVGASHARCNISANQGGWRGKGQVIAHSNLSDDMIIVGFEGAPAGTLSRDGSMIKCAGGGWHALWWHEGCVRCGTEPVPAPARTPWVV